jgi:pyruvate decarboxylase
MPFVTEDRHDVEIAAYLFTRLAQVDVLSIHGVPGDFNLAALDFLESCGVKWVGNCNEYVHCPNGMLRFADVNSHRLNAGYAADGYARIKGMGALATTFGVGELSAINAIAGSYAEHVPVVHIVGAPASRAQKAGAILHHSLGDGQFEMFAEMHSKVTVAQANLDDVNTAAQEIDRVLELCWRKKQPVYIRLPSDYITEKVDGHRLRTPIDLSSPKNEIERERAVVRSITDRLYRASRPVIVIDGGAQRHRVSAFDPT